MKNLKNKSLIIGISIFTVALISTLYMTKDVNIEFNENEIRNGFSRPKHTSSSVSLTDKTSHDEHNTSQRNLDSIKQRDQKSKVYILKFAAKIDALERIKLLNMSESEFLKILRKGLSAFPTKAEIQKLSHNEVHTIPVPLSLAGEYLGHLTKHLKNNPRLLDVTLIFYDECAKKSELLLSV
ncbi:MAG: hypothetical protein HN576_14595, partial [Bacteriovoracaceae bacterium]|nr:hypothetical protein [Bacteriovoracaceae bacterium]